MLQIYINCQETIMSKYIIKFHKLFFHSCEVTSCNWYTIKTMPMISSCENNISSFTIY